MTDPFPSLESFLCFGLYAASRAMSAVYQPLLDPLGLTYPQYMVLVSLWQKDERLVGEIGECLALETNTLTPLLKRMEATGLIRRQRSTVDERKVIVALTDRGRVLQDRAAHIPGEILSATGLSVEDAQALTAQVTQLRTRLAEYRDRAAGKAKPRRSA